MVRHDGVCPKCGINTRPERPHAVKSRDSYCPQCRREYERLHFDISRYDTVPLCAACGIEPRYVTPAGKVYTYCLECKRKRDKTSLLKRSLKKR